MKNFLVFLLSIIILVVIGGFLIRAKKERRVIYTVPNPPPAPTIHEYYWGIECEQCQNVEEFLSDWQEEDTIKIEKMEVFENEGNAELMVKRILQCNIPKEEVDVPFLVTPSGDCYFGELPIIDYFKSLEF